MSALPFLLATLAFAPQAPQVPRTPPVSPASAGEPKTGPQAAPVVAGKAGVLVVLHADDSRISLIDLEKRSLLRRLDAKRRGREIAVTPDGRSVVVAHEDQAQLSILDLGGKDTIETVDLGSARPRSMAFAGSRLLVTTDRRQVLDVDLATRTVKRRIEVGADGLDQIVVSADAKRAYVGATDTGAVVAVDLDRGNVLYRVAVTAGIDGLAFHGKDLWAANPRANALYVIDPAAAQLVQTVSCPGGPSRIAASGRSLLVTCPQSDDVAVYQAEGRTSYRRVPAQYGSFQGNASTGSAPILLVPGGMAYLPSSVDRRILVLDVTALQFRGRIDLEGRPRALAFIAKLPAPTPSTGGK